MFIIFEAYNIASNASVYGQFFCGEPFKTTSWGEVGLFLVLLLVDLPQLFVDEKFNKYKTSKSFDNAVIFERNLKFSTNLKNFFVFKWRYSLTRNDSDCNYGLIWKHFHVLSKTLMPILMKIKW